MKILTAAEIREVDRLSTEAYGVPGLLLMENAGMRVVEALEARFEDLAGAGVAILCGKGNNGGDGLVVARQLLQKGGAPAVFLFADPAVVRGDARVNLDILVRLGHAPITVTNAEDWDRERAALGPVDLVIDALFGTGLSAPLEGFLGQVVARLEDDFPGAAIVSIDVPSGAAADRPELIGPTVDADLTVTLGALKPCLVFPPACRTAGEVVVAAIGNPPALVEADAHGLDLLSPEAFPAALDPREPDTHKGDYGRILVIGGSRGKSGAAAMAAEAALRAGAGLVTTASAASALPAIAAHAPEVMTEPLPETADGALAGAALDRIEDLVRDKTVVALGPGLGGDPETWELVRRAFARIEATLVVDADGLNAFAADPAGLRGREGRPVVITPHPGEMARLTGTSIPEVQRNRLEVARAFARDRRLYVVLKGFRTLIAGPDGRVFVNPTGNAGMATAGSGDILTGMIAGLLGQPNLGLFTERLALAVYLHGLAGDLAVAELGEECLTATDLLRFLPRAWAALRAE